MDLVELFKSTDMPTMANFNEKLNKINNLFSETESNIGDLSDSVAYFGDSTNETLPMFGSIVQYAEDLSSVFDAEYGNGIYVFVKKNSVYYYNSNTNVGGLVTVRRSTSYDSNWHSVMFDGSRFVMFGVSDSSAGVVDLIYATSTNGADWTVGTSLTRISPASQDNFVFGGYCKNFNKYYVALGSGYSTGYFAVGSAPSSMSKQSFSYYGNGAQITAAAGWGLACNDSTIVMIASYSSSTDIIYSTNGGSTWTYLQSSTSQYYYNYIRGNNAGFAFYYNGYIYYSGTGTSTFSSIAPAGSILRYYAANNRITISDDSDHTLKMIDAPNASPKVIASSTQLSNYRSDYGANTAWILSPDGNMLVNQNIWTKQTTTTSYPITNVLGESRGMAVYCAQGNYIGTGETSKTLTFDFIPSFVAIATNTASHTDVFSTSANTNTPLVAIYVGNSGGSPYGTWSLNETSISISANSSSSSWYGMNVSGKVYKYIAIGWKTQF